MISIKISSHKSVRAPKNITSNLSTKMEPHQGTSGLSHNQQQQQQQQTEQLVSQVEIKYQQPIAAKRLINNNNGRKQVISQSRTVLSNPKQRPYQRPRGSLSSCSSSSPDLSGAGEEEEEEEEEDDDKDNDKEQVQYGAQLANQQLGRLIKDANNHSIDRAAPINRMVALNKQPQQANRQPISGRVHTRSISLIVNPEFDGSDSDGSVFEVSTKTTTAPARPQRVNYHHRRQRSAVRLASAHEQAELFKALNLKHEEASSCSREVAQQQSHSVNSRVVLTNVEPSKAVLEQPDESCANNCSIKADQANDDAESDSSGLRKIGLVLRQISDEFSRNRRWTI